MTSMNYEGIGSESSANFIPVGKQHLTISRAALSIKKEVELTFTVIGGADDGADVFMSYGIHSEHEKYRSYSRSALSRLAFACGLNNFADTDDFLDLEFVGEIGARKQSGGYPDKPTIYSYEKIDASRSSASKAKEYAGEQLEPNDAAEEDFDDDIPF